MHEHKRQTFVKPTETMRNHIKSHQIMFQPVSLQTHVTITKSWRAWPSCPENPKPYTVKIMVQSVLKMIPRMSLYDSTKSKTCLVMSLDTQPISHKNYFGPDLDVLGFWKAACITPALAPNGKNKFRNMYIKQFSTRMGDLPVKGLRSAEQIHLAGMLGGRGVGGR